MQPGVISQGAFNHYGACAYFGPEIGYDCGNVVRPAAIYQWYPSLITAGSWIGYFKPETSIVLCDSSIGIWTPVLYGLSTFGYPLAWRVGISDFDLDCVNHTYTEIYAGDSGVNGVDCSGSGAASFTVGATTLALGPA